MSLKDDLINQVNTIFDEVFNITPGIVIPTVGDIPLDNQGKEINAAMLFIDIKNSTNIVAAVQRSTAARMYKAFLKGVTKISLNNGGEVRSFNGDGVLVVFVGDWKCNKAVTAAMQMKYFFINILKPKWAKYRLHNSGLGAIDLNFGIGVAVGKILVVKAGIGGENNRDLVWVGNATNKAVKLAEKSTGDYHINITADVYSPLKDILKYKKSTLSLSFPIWQRVISLTPFGYIYRSTYWIAI